VPKDWSLRTRLKVAAVVALLGLLVWADARWAGTAQCPPTGTSTTGTSTTGTSTTGTSATAPACPAR
jgi:hypothetical protein